jgi:hypothetical protein
VAEGAGYAFIMLANVAGTGNGALAPARYGDCCCCGGGDAWEVGVMFGGEGFAS